jgi:acyl-CoA dehydrogenase
MSGAYEDALAGATPYLRMMGTVLGGWLLAGGAVVATREAAVEGADRDFLLAKIATARFYATQILPQAAGLGSAVTSGAEVVMGVSTT